MGANKMINEANSKSLTISVIGLGYIGLPTATMFASHRKNVIGIDVDKLAVDTINRGEIHIVEPDLGIAVRSAVGGGYLRATTKPEPADAFLIAVPTPFRGDDHEPDLSYIKAAALSIAPVLSSENLIVLESTSPVGATQKLAEWLAEARPDLKFPQEAGETSDVRIAYCPERVLPGKIMRELIQNDRVIGGMTKRCADAAVELYKIFVKGEFVVTDVRTAEMAKLTENSFRDVNIAFANELAEICDELDIDVWELIATANRHPRVSILQPGPGVGGHCIAVDPWFIINSAPSQARLHRVAREVNDARPKKVAAKIMNAINKTGASTIACFGLAYKPDVDDVRESPAVEIVELLAAQGVERILICEPHLTVLPAALRRHDAVSLVDARTAYAEADVYAFLVAHSEFAGDAASRSSLSKSIVDATGLMAARN